MTEAARQLQHSPQESQGFRLMESAKFRFYTLEEAESIAALASHCFPEPARAATGLLEVMVNAIEHGNLGIGYERKTELLNQGTSAWRAEVSRVQQEEAHRGKPVDMVIVRKPEGVFAVIQDAGEGFQWQRYVSADPMRAGSSHGRGIAKAAACFDRLSYNKSGNQAVCFASSKEPLEW